MLQIDGFDIYVDLPGYQSPSNIFYDTVRPDMVLKRDRHLIIIELTCCFETNFEKSRNFKIEKYESIKQYSKVPVDKLEKFFLEVSSLGFITKCFKSFERFISKKNIDCKRLKEKLSETAIRASYYIYTRRNSNWNSPNLLKFI